MITPVSLGTGKIRSHSRFLPPGTHILQPEFVDQAIQEVTEFPPSLIPVLLSFSYVVELTQDQPSGGYSYLCAQLVNQ